MYIENEMICRFDVEPIPEINTPEFRLTHRYIRRNTGIRYELRLQTLFGVHLNVVMFSMNLPDCNYIDDAKKLFTQDYWELSTDKDDDDNLLYAEIRIKVIPNATLSFKFTDDRKGLDITKIIPTGSRSIYKFRMKSGYVLETGMFIRQDGIRKNMRPTEYYFDDYNEIYRITESMRPGRHSTE